MEPKNDNVDAEETEKFNLDVTKKTSIDLLPDEKKVFLREPAISTATFYDGDPTTAAKYLKDRVSAIVSSNKWLGGRLNTTGGDLKLWYDPDGEDAAPDLFREFEPGEVLLSRSAPVKDAEKLRLLGVEIKNNQELVDKNEGVWRVSLVPDAESPTDRFVLVVSMSHVVGDADTYYRVFKMLGSDTNVTRLNPKRLMDFNAQVEEKMGKEEANYLANLAANHSFEKTCEDAGGLSPLIFYASNEWVKEQKEQYRQEVVEAEKKLNPGQKVGRGMVQALAFVLPIPDQTAEDLFPSKCGADKTVASALTPNDIVSSWFLKTLEPTVGLKALNFRNRVPGLTDKHAGNYKEAIPYAKDDYASALLIRKSYDTARRVGATSKDRPTKLWTPEDGGKPSFGICTNWCAYFGGKLDLGKGFQQDIHVPLFDPKDISLMFAKMSFIITFTAKPGKSAAFVLVPKSDVPKIEESKIVEEVIAKV